MIIKQKRIKNLSKLSSIKKNTEIIVAVLDLEHFQENAINIGFTRNLDFGEKVLPKVVGPWTNRNANGYEIIHKDKPKEIKYRMIEWTYNQYAGRGETIEVTDSTEVPYKRYQRSHVLPLSIELMIVNNNGKKNIISPSFILNSENKKEIISIINVFLEIFGECFILDNSLSDINYPEVIRLNWEVLPKGKFPWDKQKERVKVFLNKAKRGNRPVIDKRLETINKEDPDFVAIGLGGFSGYLIFGFEEQNLFILESTRVDNATYVFEDEWEKLSQLSKAEILNESLHKYRIYHTKNWYERIKNILN